MSVWFLYMIRCRDGSLYTGITTDTQRRLADHQNGGKTGSRYLRGKGPLKLVFTKKIGGRSLATKVERLVKKLPKVQKENLVEEKSSIDRIVQKASPNGVTNGVKSTLDPFRKLL